MIKPTKEDEKNYNIRYISTVDLKKLQWLCNTNTPMGYRKFCGVLNIPVLHSGSNKQMSQLQQLEQYCDIKKEGRNYIFSNYHEFTPKDNSNTTTKRFGLTWAETTSPKLYTIYSLQDNYAIVGSTQNFNKSYLRHIYQAQGDPEFFPEIYKSKHNVELYDETDNFHIRDLIKSMQQRGYTVLNKKVKGYSLRKQRRNFQMFEQLYDAIDKQCKATNVTQRYFLDHLIRAIEYNPNRWVENMVLTACWNRGYIEDDIDPGDFIKKDSNVNPEEMVAIDPNDLMFEPEDKFVNDSIELKYENLDYSSMPLEERQRLFNQLMEESNKESSF